MSVNKNKRKIIGSSAALLSILIHIIILFIAGGVVALRYFSKEPASFTVTEQKKIQNRELIIPVEVQPIMEKMSKSSPAAKNRLTVDTPQKINIPKKNDYTSQLLMPTFKGNYTNFVTKDRTLIMNSRFRNINYGLSKVDFFGSREKTEKIVVIMDSSPNMVEDINGGLMTYQILTEEIKQFIHQLNSSTLFNFILYDRDKTILFNEELIPATDTHKTNFVEWISCINTNIAELGLNTDANNLIYKSSNYLFPMDQKDITGWLKAVKLAVQYKPEVIFLLAGDWGSITDPYSDFSYFVKTENLEYYLDERLSFLLNDEDKTDDWLEMTEITKELSQVAKIMRTLENQARREQLIDPKISHSIDQILWENNVEKPEWISIDEPSDIGTYPVETRYSFEEVIETLFTFTMETYREEGFPKIHFTIMEQNGNSSYNSTAGSALLTTPVKFSLLAKMLDCKIQIMNAEPPIDNVLNQNYYDILDLIEAEEK